MSNVEVELYYANWCGHCIRFKPVWNQFIKAVDGKIKCSQYEESKEPKLIREKI